MPVWMPTDSRHRWPTAGRPRSAKVAVSGRRHDRVALALEVEYRSAGAFLVAYSANLSKGGIFIETDNPLTVGTEIPMRFAVPGEVPIDVMGVVAWVQAWRTERLPRGMGIRFEQLDERYGEAIDRIVSTFRGLRVLVMSADRSSRGQLARSLRTIIGSAEIIEVSDSDSAEHLLAPDCDLLIVELLSGLEDVLEPDPNAVDVGGSADVLLCMRLAKVRQPPVPVLALSGDEERRQIARELGADLTLSSPPPFPELQTAVVRLLGKPHSTALK